jgi:hypothetical protein
MALHASSLQRHQDRSCTKCHSTRTWGCWFHLRMAIFTLMTKIGGRESSETISIDKSVFRCFSSEYQSIEEFCLVSAMLLAIIVAEP